MNSKHEPYTNSLRLKAKSLQKKTIMIKEECTFSSHNYISTFSIVCKAKEIKYPGGIHHMQLEANKFLK